MNIIRIGDLDVEVLKKDIKNIHLWVYSPIGRVRLSAPISYRWWKDQAIYCVKNTLNKKESAKV